MSPDPSRRLYALVALATLLGAVHHVDHLVRGNHVGWPVTGSVNAFTFSLVVYPVVAFGLVLGAYGRGRPDYWLAVGGFGLALLGVVHLGPWAVEPPGDVVGPYDNGLVGLLAFGVVLALLCALAVSTVVAAREAVRERRS